MNFTLKQLRYVEAAGRLESISKAAQEMAISQSSIAAALDALESSLNHDLFLRTPAKGIQTTPVGEDSLTLIRSFINQARHFESELESLGRNTSGHVRIGCYISAAPAFLPPILQNITENFPEMSVQVLEGDLDAVTTFLNDGKVDLAFTYHDVAMDGQTFIPLFKAPPYALIGIDDPLSQQEFVTFAELENRPMVLLDLPRTREYFKGFFERRGLRPKIAHTTRSAEIARALVAGGFGYTILNIRPLDHENANMRYRAIAIEGASSPHSFGIATLTGIREPNTVRAFIESCQNLSKNGAFDNLAVWQDPPIL